MVCTKLFDRWGDARKLIAVVQLTYFLAGFAAGVSDSHFNVKASTFHFHFHFAVLKLGITQAMSKIEQRLIRVGSKKFVILFGGFVIIMHHIACESGIGVRQFARGVRCAIDDFGDGGSTFVAREVGLQNGRGFIGVFGDDARTACSQYQHHRYLILYEKIEELLVAGIDFGVQIVNVAGNFRSRRFANTENGNGIGGK